MNATHQTLNTTQSSKGFVQENIIRNQQVNSLYLYNYSNTVFQISTFYKDENSDYEEQVDEELFLKGFDWYCIKPRIHNGREMKILGIQFLDIGSNVNSCTFFLNNLMTNLKYYWRDEMLNLHDIQYTHDFNNYRQDLNEKDNIFVLTKHVGENIQLYYYKNKE